MLASTSRRLLQRIIALWPATGAIELEASTPPEGHAGAV
jgi:hypothetical protein